MGHTSAPPGPAPCLFSARADIACNCKTHRPNAGMSTPPSRRATRPTTSAPFNVAERYMGRELRVAGTAADSSRSSPGTQARASLGRTMSPLLGDLPSKARLAVYVQRGRLIRARSRPCSLRSCTPYRRLAARASVYLRCLYRRRVSQR